MNPKNPKKYWRVERYVKYVQSKLGFREASGLLNIQDCLWTLGKACVLLKSCRTVLALSQSFNFSASFRHLGWNAQLFLLWIMQAWLNCDKRSFVRQTIPFLLYGQRQGKHKTLHEAICLDTCGQLILMWDWARVLPPNLLEMSQPMTPHHVCEPRATRRRWRRGWRDVSKWVREISDGFIWPTSNVQQMCFI